MTLVKQNSKVLKQTLRGLDMTGDNNLEEWQPSDWVLSRLEKLGMTLQEVKMLNRKRNDENKRARNKNENE